MYIEIKENEIIKAGSSYSKELDCYEVELIKNDTPADTVYRLEFIDGDYINISINELKGLKELLNNKEVSKLILKELN